MQATIIENDESLGRVQGSDLWLCDKWGKISATAAHTLLINGKGARTLENKKVEERVTPFEDRDTLNRRNPNTDAMKRGHINEPKARAAAIKHFGVDIREVYLCTVDDYICYSPDGLSTCNNYDWEAKSFYAENHNKIIEKGITKYKSGAILDQLLFRMEFGQVDNGLFTAYCEDVQVKEIKGKLFYIEPIKKVYHEEVKADDWRDRMKEIREAVVRSVENIKKSESKEREKRTIISTPDLPWLKSNY